MRSPEHALKLSKQAFGSNADGVFLIDHDSHHTPEVLTSAYQFLRQELGAKAWIGVNYLTLYPGEAVRHLFHAKENEQITQFPDALWSDDAISTADLHDVPALKHVYGMEGVEYFGGIALKYTPSYTENPELAAALALEYAPAVDVATTSGPGTGYAVSVDKVAAMRQALVEAGLGTPLALASGVSIANIDSYRPYVDRVLAASSIETGLYSGVFDLYRMHELIEAAHRD